MPGAPGVPLAEELLSLPHAELAAMCAEAYRVIAGMTVQAQEMTARVRELAAEGERLAARVEALERQAGKDSSTSSKPPSSDSPYKKEPRDRSLRERGKRRPGKQPGEPGATMRLVDDPDHRFWHPPAECRDCGTDLSGQEIFAQRRHQVTDIRPAPPPDWAAQMAALLLEARDAARSARAEGKKALDQDILGDLTGRYRDIAESGLAANVYRRTTTANDARRVARRFLKHEDMILRFITRPDVDIFTNHEAERAIRPVKVRQRASGGCWRTLDGLADFAVVQSYLSTATKWGITKLDALRGLFHGTPWMPPGLEPAPG